MCARSRVPWRRGPHLGLREGAVKDGGSMDTLATCGQRGIGFKQAAGVRQGFRRFLLHVVTQTIFTAGDAFSTLFAIRLGDFYDGFPRLNSTLCRFWAKSLRLLLPLQRGLY